MIEEYEDAIKTYGLSEEDVFKLSPYDRFVSVFGTPTEYLAEKTTWEYVVSYPMSAEYANIAHWNIEMAFREILQNALDGANELGYGNESVNIYLKSPILYIENPSKPIQFKHMKLGGSDKPCWSRGRYGEGLKVASAYIVNTGGTVYIIYDNIVFRYILPKKDLTILLGKLERTVCQKTIVAIVHRETGKMERLVDKILYKPEKVLSSVKVTREDCDYEAPSSISKKQSEKGSLYVRDMYVNTFEELTGEDSIFDWNLWWIGLSRDRTHINSVYELKSAMSDVIYRMPPIDREKIAKIIADKIIKAKLTTEGAYLVANGKYFELTTLSDFPFTTEYLRQSLTDEIISKYNLNEDLTGVTRSPAILNKAIYLGYVPILWNIPTENVPLTLRNIEDVIAEHADKTTKNASENKLTLNDLLEPETLATLIQKDIEPISIKNTIGCLTFIDYIRREDIIKFDSEYYASILAEIEGTTETDVGFYSNSINSIIIGIDRMSNHHPVDVGIEEITHAATKAGDIESRFEKELIRISREIFEATTSMDAWDEYYLSASGLFIGFDSVIDFINSLNTIGIQRDDIYNIAESIYGLSYKTTRIPLLYRPKESPTSIKARYIDINSKLLKAYYMNEESYLISLVPPSVEIFIPRPNGEISKIKGGEI